MLYNLLKIQTFSYSFISSVCFTTHVVFMLAVKICNIFESDFHKMFFFLLQKTSKYLSVVYNLVGI
jgi:hypothetical protein